MTKARDVATADGDVRFVPGEATGFADLAHRSRYAWAVATFAKPGLNILDFGCGSGYGVAQMRESHHVGMVDGIDISPIGIAFAERKFGDPRTTFLALDAAGPDTPNLLGKRYDLITSFDVIEHVEKYDLFVSNISQILATDGIALIGCPNRLQTFAWNRRWNKHHMQEFTPHQLRGLLEQSFEEVMLVGQDIPDEALRDQYCAENRGPSEWGLAIRELLPLRVMRFLKFAKSSFAKRPDRKSGTSGLYPIEFAIEPSDEQLARAFGLVAICRHAKL